MTLSTSLGRLRLIGFLEGISFIVLLFIAMPLKYFAGWPDAVRVVGMAHGVLFLAYIGAIVPALLDHRWPLSRAAWLVLASLLPFGPFVADRKWLRAEEAQQPA